MNRAGDSYLKNWIANALWQGVSGPVEILVAGSQHDSIKILSFGMDRFFGEPDFTMFIGWTPSRPDQGWRFCGAQQVLLMKDRYGRESVYYPS